MTKRTIMIGDKIVFFICLLGLIFTALLTYTSVHESRSLFWNLFMLLINAPLIIATIHSFIEQRKSGKEYKEWKKDNE
jgi:hypothetical protein